MSPPLNFCIEGATQGASTNQAEVQAERGEDARAGQSRGCRQAAEGHPTGGQGVSHTVALQNPKK